MSLPDARQGATRGELVGVCTSVAAQRTLEVVSSPVCDARGNCGVERAAFEFRDAAGVLRTGTVIDVHLPAQR